MERAAIFKLKITHQHGSKLTKPPVVDNVPIYDSLMLGSRIYELSNHLGNVLSTISDKKIGHDSSGVVNYYLAEVLLQSDYFCPCW